MRIPLFFVAITIFVTACGGSGGSDSSSEQDGSTSAPFGLDARPTNYSCLAVAPPASDIVKLERVFPDLELVFLTALEQAPNDSTAWYFATQNGWIRRFNNDENVSAFREVLDITDVVKGVPDGGLIQFKFHPNYPDDRRVFVNYSTQAADGISTADIIISSFTVSADGLSIDRQSETVLFRQPRGSNHQGGFMAFDNSGLLYVGLGDGTTQGDPTGRAQDLSDMRGKILRVDVDSAAPYAIPDGNPYSGRGGNPLEEIFSLGMRNPYRGDIDLVSGKIFVADVGWKNREEINQIRAGANFGWNIKEGTNCVSQQYGSCSDPTLVDPLIEYSHDSGNCSVIGGYFYRGEAIPSLRGDFIFADYCTSKISAVKFDTGGHPVEMPLVPGGSGIGHIVSFAKDNAGELYVVSHQSLYKILPANSSTGPLGPAEQLSQTGCFDPNDASIPAAGLVPYELQAPLWSDGAGKRRWIALPEGRTIDLDPDGDFLFPEGTVLVKEFSVNEQLVETRLFMRDVDGVWNGYSYEWIGNDAFLLPAGKEKQLSNGQIWSFPDRGECLRCHTEQANFALGPEIGQLNAAMLYSETNRNSNQLATFEHIGFLTNGLPASPEELPAYAKLNDDSQSLSRRARSYLHSNCSGCHRNGGTTQSDMDLRFVTSRTDMNVCNVDPVLGDLGISGAKLLAPGAPAMSILLARPSLTNPLYRMPPLGTSIVHDEAMSILNSWIRSPHVCAVESDTDLDQVPDDADNCPSTSNPDQADFDKDGIGDLCEFE